MIGKRAEEVLNRAVRLAAEKRHEYFTLEHVLFSLLQHQEIADIVGACNADTVEMQTDLERFLEREIPTTSKTPDTDAKPEGEEESKRDRPMATLSIQRLIQRALFQVQSSGKEEIQPEDLFVALFQSKDSYALHMLNKRGIERLDVINFVSHGIRKGEEAPEESEDEGESSGPSSSSSKGTKDANAKGLDTLSQYTVNLNKLAQEGRLDPLVGRALELERMIQTLCRRRKNNPILVGEAGVGKTALAEGLAWKIHHGEVPEILREAEIFSLDVGALIAGTKFRGDFEQRLKKVLTTLQAKKEKGGFPVLFIDEIHNIIGAGAVSGGTLDAANLMKPLLARGDLRCIGSTTYNEYRTIFEKDQGLARRFQKIDVSEPTQDEAIQILNGLKAKFEEYHHVKFTPESIRSAVELSVKHLTDRFLPDKAIDVMDEAGARMRILHPERKAPHGDPVEITSETIEEMIAKIARIPTKKVSLSQKDRLRNLERDLKIAIFGQDHAVEKVVSAIRLSRSGLRSGDKPVGSFLFCGPTGVGKTELAKQLSHGLGVPFLRYDMSEYSEKHTVSRLIGAPPGYVGFEQSGLMTNDIVKTPYAVVLMDEIEKAHPEIWNLLLQVMDHGFLTDNNGRKADFRNAVIIMTSNVGAREAERRSLGILEQVGQGNSIAKAEVERTFTPEFRNRLDAIVYFNPLDPVTIGQVVGKNLMELESQLLAKGVEIDLEPEVREWLASKGYDRTMGARPMARLIQDELKRPLAEELLFGKLEQGGSVVVSMKDGKPHFDITPKGSDKDGDGESSGGSPKTAMPGVTG